MINDMRLLRQGDTGMGWSHILLESGRCLCLKSISSFIVFGDCLSHLYYLVYVRKGSWKLTTVYCTISCTTFVFSE